MSGVDQNVQTQLNAYDPLTAEAKAVLNTITDDTSSGNFTLGETITMLKAKNPYGSNSSYIGNNKDSGESTTALLIGLTGAVAIGLSALFVVKKRKRA